jgi:hypothetical protein
MHLDVRQLIHDVANQSFCHRLPNCSRRRMLIDIGQFLILLNICFCSLSNPKAMLQAGIEGALNLGVIYCRLQSRGIFSLCSFPFHINSVLSLWPVLSILRILRHDATLLTTLSLGPLHSINTPSVLPAVNSIQCDVQQKLLQLFSTNRLDPGLCGRRCSQCILVNRVRSTRDDSILRQGLH